MWRFFSKVKTVLCEESSYLMAKPFKNWANHQNIGRKSGTDLPHAFIMGGIPSICGPALHVLLVCVECDELGECNVIQEASTRGRIDDSNCACGALLRNSTTVRDLLDLGSG
jgi:hypothetical protein